MDITSKYRTLKAPKEHEEAVKMLLENIAANSARVVKAPVNNPPRQSSISSDAASSKYKSSDGVDLHSLNSSSTNECSSASSSAAAEFADNIAMMQSKSTSTTSDAMSSDSIGQSHQDSYRQPIPSRTIAVQCDLKPSPLRNNATESQFDESMTASSISSTKYGFYSFSPETLHNRRKIQRSIANRNNQNSTSLSTSQARLNALEPANIEAPTSMSELSSISSTSTSNYSDFDDDDRVSVRQRQVPTAGNHLAAANRLAPTKIAADKPKKQEQTVRPRPMTALSYVSTSRLRDAQSPLDYAIDDDVRGPSQLLASRALSQQVLNHQHSRRRSSPVASIVSSGSDQVESHLKPNVSGKQHQTDRFRLPRSEEMLLTKSLEPALQASKPPKPQLVSSHHNEQVHDYSAAATTTLDRGHKPAASTSDNSSYLKKMPIKEADDIQSASDSVKRWPPPPPLNSISSLANQQQQVNSAGMVRDKMAAADSRLNRAQQQQYDRSARYRTLTGDPRLDGSRYSARQAPVAVNSMSLSRASRQQHLLSASSRLDNSENQYQTPMKRASTMSRADGVYSQNLLANSTTDSPNKQYSSRTLGNYSSRPEVVRSTSMRQINDDSDAWRRNRYARPTGQTYGQQRLRPQQMRSVIPDSDDSECPSTRTWASPVDGENLYGARGKSSIRSASTMRNLAAEMPQPYEPATNEFQSYSSSSEVSLQETDTPGFVNSQHLDYDSRYRLNESGLPPPQASNNELNSQSTRRPKTASSYLGVSNLRDTLAYSQSRNSSSRPVQVAGRAMSQQSLSRSSMPYGTSRRRTNLASGSNSGSSDVGGSSMSLVSRLPGRYENAHTRTPIVMYIPQATPKPSSTGGSIGASKSATTLRKSARSKIRSTTGSNDRLRRRSSSRNTSDSESSSMLRTLVKPRNRNNLAASKRSIKSSLNRRGNRNDPRDDDEEDMDGVGQLASEMDSYKFRRRYSVPKDAKINWFSKLKQKVTSSAR